MGFPINLPSGKGMTINYILCKYSFGLFFFWRKSGTVVVVGVPDVFFALRVDWLFDFFEERKKAMCQLCVWTAKSVTEKNNSREDLRKPE